MNFERSIMDEMMLNLPNLKALSASLFFITITACSNELAELTKKTSQPNEMSMQKSKQVLLPPTAKKIKHILSKHQQIRNDPYYWLRDDKRENVQVLNYLKAENEYSKQKLAHTQELQDQLYQEMTARLEINKESVAVFHKGYWLKERFDQGMDYKVHIRQKASLDAPEEIILDQNKRAEGLDYYQLDDLTISPNQKLLAISEDRISRRRYQIQIKDIATEKYFTEIIKNTSGEIVWSNDSQYFFYVTKDKNTLLPYQVYRHHLGDEQKQDVLIYEEKDNTFYTEIYKTQSDQYLVIDISSTMSSEARLIDLDSPSTEPKLFLAREKNHKYQLDHIAGYFYATSDLDAANNKLIKVKENQIGNKTHWQVIVKHRNDRLLKSFALFNHYIVDLERVNGVEKLLLRDFQGKIIDQIKFKDPVYSVSIGNNPDPAASSIRYHYTSMTTPRSIYQYDVSKQSSQLLKQDKILGGFKQKNYATERIMIKARDGKKVPLSIVYRKDLFKKNNTNPLLHYAYGSYGSTITPSFSLARLSLLDRGFVYVISHIRGGKMLGRQWYEDGKKLNKLNTFNDFNDATKALVTLGYADEKRIYAVGRSAGGLLMGAIINQQPELYHGVIASVPFVDVVTTMLDESIPLTTGEYDEWGNPNDPVYYDYMLSYSPYDQVKKQNYPNLLVTSGLYDSQVQYWEPAKWVAKLRDLKTDDNLLLLDTDMEVGHGGKSGRYQAFLDTAKEYAFILSLAGINK